MYLQLSVEKSKLFKYLIVDYVKAEKATQSLCKSKNKVENFFSDLKKQYSLLEKENIVFRQQINDIKSGWSFKIGRVITFLPRKIRGFLEKLIK